MFFRQLDSHSAVVVFGLQVYSPNNVYPDETLLRSTLRELSELTRWRCNTRIIWEGVHLEGTLKIQKHEFNFHHFKTLLLIITLQAKYSL